MPDAGLSAAAARPPRAGKSSSFGVACSDSVDLICKQEPLNR